MLKKLALALSLTLVTLTLAVPAQAQTVGLPPDGSPGSCYPFGCTGSAGTRYQQVYHWSNFALPFTITDISFFDTAFFGPDRGFLNSGTYTFSLSTTTRDLTGANGLSAAFDTNLGADNTLFGVYVLTGQASDSVLTFTSTTSGFSFNPLLGMNLLLDIQIAGISHAGANSFQDARNGNADSTMFSRMHDFNGGFEGFGLVTQFESGGLLIGVVPEPGTVFLLATGLVGLGMAARRRQKGLSS